MWSVPLKDSRALPCLDTLFLNVITIVLVIKSLLIGILHLLEPLNLKFIFITKSSKRKHVNNLYANTESVFMCQKSSSRAVFSCFKFDCTRYKKATI